MSLGEAERRSIEERARLLEARTGAEVVAAVVSRCHEHPEVPWKAFALGAALAAVAMPLLGPRLGGWPTGPVPLGLSVLGAGSALAILTLVWARFARLFLEGHRADAEVRRFGESLFLSRELFRTPDRMGILLLVSRFERRVVVLVDAGVRERVPEAELRPVVERMTRDLGAGRVAPALAAGLEALEALLLSRGFAGRGGADAIPDELVEARGP